jgi:hypothetical protein
VIDIAAKSIKQYLRSGFEKYPAARSHHGLGENFQRLKVKTTFLGRFLMRAKK